MKYSLVIYNKDSLEIEKITGYTKTMAQEFNEDSLEDIVKFTHLFASEKELWSYLIYSGLIEPQTNDNYALGIALYKHNLNPKLLPYGLSFAKDQKFYDCEFLKNYYRSKLFNLDFMHLFTDKYYQALRKAGTLGNLISSLNNSYMINLIENKLPTVEDEHDMVNFVGIYTHHKNAKGRYLESFSKIRELAMFAINYERIYKREKHLLPKEDLLFLKTEIEHYKELLKEAKTNEEYEAYNSKLTRLAQSYNDSKKNERSYYDEVTRNKNTR